MISGQPLGHTVPTGNPPIPDLILSHTKQQHLYTLFIKIFHELELVHIVHCVHNIENRGSWPVESVERTAVMRTLLSDT